MPFRVDDAISFHQLVAPRAAVGIKASKVQMLNMKPLEIVAARGNAATSTPPTSAVLRSDAAPDRHTIVTSEEVGQKSVPTFGTG